MANNYPGIGDDCIDYGSQEEIHALLIIMNKLW
jgi:hypothetical protein